MGHCSRQARGDESQQDAVRCAALLSRLNRYLKQSVMTRSGFRFRTRFITFEKRCNTAWNEPEKIHRTVAKRHSGSGLQGLFLSSKLAYCLCTVFAWVAMVRDLGSSSDVCYTRSTSLTFLQPSPVLFHLEEAVTNSKFQRK
ncbi:protein of unknown function [Pseudomonas sp. JV241A]|nr:protein of unknown function [Pseudomonas sp. JV241A]